MQSGCYHGLVDSTVRPSPSFLLYIIKQAADGPYKNCEDYAVCCRNKFPHGATAEPLYFREDLGYNIIVRNK